MSELSNEAKALIRRVGTADGPSPVDRARVKRHIVAGLAGAGMVFGSGGTIASGAPAGVLGAMAASKVTVTSVALWLAAGAGLGTVVSTPALVSAYHRAESTRPVASAIQAAKPLEPANARPATQAPRAPLGSARSERVSPDSAEGRPAAAERPRAAPTTRGVAPNSMTAAASLAEETQLLQAAQRELAQKRTAAALALLDEHAAKFPRGALAEERTGARVLALCDLGRLAEARSAAAAFVRASPHSPLVPRLRASCAWSEPRADALGQ